MLDERLSRRRLIANAAAIGAAGALGLSAALPAGAAPKGSRTTPLTPAEQNAVATALGKPGTYAADQGVYSVPLPRNDLQVTVGGDPVPISFGFGGWVAVKRTVDGRSAVLMSDTVLLEEEVNPLITAAQAQGLGITALHNHFFGEQPRIFFMHLHGMGQPADLAKRYAAAIGSTKLFPANQPPPGAPPEQTAKERFDLPALDAVIKHAGVVNGASYKVTLGRDDLRVTAMGAVLTAAIGLNTWAAFAGDRDRAHIAGDIAMLEPEVNPVIAALRAHQLEVVAVHQHMLGEQPRIIFLHYHGVGAALDLARGFRAAVEELGKHGKPMGSMPMGGRPTG